MLLLFLFTIQLYALPLISNDEFETYKTEKEHVIGFYSLEHCLHCRELKPAMEQVEEQIEDDEKINNVAIYQIDCSHSQCPFDQFPQLILFKNGNEYSKYDGQKKASTILRWIERLQRPLFEEIDPDDVEDLQYEYEVLYVIKFQSKEIKDDYMHFFNKELPKIQSEMRHFVYYISKYIPKKMKIEITMRDIYESSKLIKTSFDTNHINDKLKIYLRNHIKYPYQRYSEEYELDVNKYGTTVIVIYGNDISDGFITMKSIQKYWGKALGMFVPLTMTEIYPQTHYGTNIKRLFPSKQHIRIITSHERITFDYFGEWKEDEINKWIEKVMNNEIESTKRGSRIISNNDIIKELTTETFDQFIQQEKDVCILVHHGNMESIYPLFSQLANGFSSSGTIVFGIVDLSTEDVLLSTKFEQMPTIVLFNPSTHQSVEIYHPKGIEATSEQLKAHVVYSLDGYNYGLSSKNKNKKESHPLEYYEKTEL